MEQGLIKRAYLLVKLDKGGLELLLDVGLAEVVGELGVRVGHALGSLLGSIVSRGRIRHGVQRHRLVLDVLDFIEVHVRDLLVLGDGRVVRGRVPGQLGEVL
jgi:hypothetical protein